MSLINTKISFVLVGILFTTALQSSLVPSQAYWQPLGNVVQRQGRDVRCLHQELDAARKIAARLQGLLDASEQRVKELRAEGDRLVDEVNSLKTSNQGLVDSDAIWRAQLILLTGEKRQLTDEVAELRRVSQGYLRQLSALQKERDQLNAQVQRINDLSLGLLAIVSSLLK